MEKILLLDIDKTIIDSDSMLLFIKYSLKNPLNILRLPWVLLVSILYLFKLVSIEYTKSVIYHPINNMSEKEIEIFFKQLINKHANQELFEIIKAKQQANYKIIMVTASIETYMKYFKIYNYADVVLGTRYNKKVIGKNCKAKEKVNRLAELNLDIDYENSYGYSDSRSDLYMLKLVKNYYQVTYPHFHQAVIKPFKN